MTDQSKEEKLPGTGEGDSQVPPSTTGGADSTGGSKGGVTLEDFKRLEGLVKQMQSGRDKLENRNQQEIKDLKMRLDQYAELRNQGLTHERAVTEMQRDEEMAELRRKLDTGTPGQLGAAPLNTQAQGDPIEAVIRGLGLDPNTPEVIEVINQRGKPLADRTASLAALAVNKPSPVSAPASVASTGIGAPLTEDLMREYQAEVKPYRGDVAKIVAIQAKYREKGLNI